MFGRREQLAAAEWQRFLMYASDHWLSIVTVIAVYQLAESGTKATISIAGEDSLSDAWFWWDRVEPGSALAVALSTGYGTHTHRSGVVYVGSQEGGSGVYARLDAKTLARTRRHQLRAVARQHRLDKRMRRTQVSPAVPR